MITFLICTLYIIIGMVCAAVLVYDPYVEEASDNANGIMMCVLFWPFVILFLVMFSILSGEWNPIWWVLKGFYKAIGWIHSKTGGI